MIRKLIFSICMICPLLAGCTDDDMMPSSQTPVSSETVPVRLNFSTEAFNTPFQGHAFGRRKYRFVRFQSGYEHRIGENTRYKRCCRSH